MKKILLLPLILLLTIESAKPQATAIDFTMNDCNGNIHNLFQELDSQKVVILEYFMNCGSCIVAAQKIEAMLNGINADYPGKTEYYMIAYVNSMTCSQVLSFMTTNNLHGIPFDSGAATMAYYGGFAMPTVVVVAGNQHQVLYNNATTGGVDTVAMGAAIRGFLSTTGINENKTPEVSFNFYPNPSSGILNIDIRTTTNSKIEIEIMNGLGQIIKRINHNTSSGLISEKVETTSFKDGVYFARIKSDAFEKTHRFTVLH
jgi:hypothetical protein